MEIKVLDFTGKWCSTCIVLDKILESEIIPLYKKRVKFVKIDIEKDEKLIKRYEILSVPTLILLKDEKEIWRKDGSMTKDELMNELNEVFK